MSIDKPNKRIQAAPFTNPLDMPNTPPNRSFVMSKQYLLKNPVTRGKIAYAAGMMLGLLGAEVSAQINGLNFPDSRSGGRESIPLLNQAEFRFSVEFEGEIRQGDRMQIVFDLMPFEGHPFLTGSRFNEYGLIRPNPPLPHTRCDPCANEFFETDPFNPFAFQMINEQKTINGVDYWSSTAGFLVDRTFTFLEPTTVGFFDLNFGAAVNAPPFSQFSIPEVRLFRDEVLLDSAKLLLGPPFNGTDFGLHAAPGPLIPSPIVVPGKEYADTPNMASDLTPRPGQTILWDGKGGVMDGLRPIDDGQIDGLANTTDTLYRSVIANRSALLFSTTDDSIAPIHFESIDGGSGIWAGQSDINYSGVEDLGALEVWGPSDVPNANRYSLLGDPVPQSTTERVAVYNHNSGGASSMAFSVTELATAVGLDPSKWELFDLDGMMTSGNRIMFSIAPISGVFDGGEIWTWRKGGFAAAFLNHGGHLWNTDFDVKGTFGTSSENIDALEAVSFSLPETGSSLVLLSGSIILLAAGKVRTGRCE